MTTPTTGALASEIANAQAERTKKLRDRVAKENAINARAYEILERLNNDPKREGPLPSWADVCKLAAEALKAEEDAKPALKPSKAPAPVNPVNSVNTVQPTPSN